MENIKPNDDTIPFTLPKNHAARLRALEMAQAGQTTLEIASALGVTQSTVQSWLQVYRERARARIAERGAELIESLAAGIEKDNLAAHHIIDEIRALQKAKVPLDYESKKLVTDLIRSRSQAYGNVGRVVQQEQSAGASVTVVVQQVAGAGDRGVLDGVSILLQGIARRTGGEIFEGDFVVDDDDEQPTMADGSSPGA